LSQIALAPDNVANGSKAGNNNDSRKRRQWLLSTQWYAIYKQGPLWVPPLLLSGGIANLYLYFRGPNHHLGPYLRHSTLAAGLLVLSLLPFTFFYLEPGINGACKWKHAQLTKELKDDQQTLLSPTALQSIVPASVTHHTATAASKAWADKADMTELVEGWVRRNHLRWVVGIVAGGLSFLGSWGLSS
jgi:hypothetical protein